MSRHISSPNQTQQTLTRQKPPSHHTTTVLWPFIWDHPGEPVSEENFWTLWCNTRLTEADTPTIQLGVTPSGLSSAHLHHPPHFLQPRCPSCRPTNSVKALKATNKKEATAGLFTALSSAAIFKQCTSVIHNTAQK